MNMRKEPPPPKDPPPPEGNGVEIPGNRRVKMRKQKPAPAQPRKIIERSGEETSWPASETELRDINTLAPYARNPRLHGEGQIDQLVASIKRWGFTIPLLADEAGQLIAGHARLEAAKRLELKRVPVMTARGWTDAQKRAYVIADNRLAQNSSWDDALLIDELSGLKISDFDLAALGFTDAELADMIGAPDAEAFGPASVDDQQRLDQKSPITCPECGHVFSPS
jgi:hypothetical protein